jgi:uncharacterized protein YndB with AHSA1/START domain
MAQLVAAAERVIARPPTEVYAALADYAGRRRAIMPPAYHDYVVESGGSGAGTVVRWTLHVGNHRRPYRMQVSEPQPGRLLVERDADSTMTTQWEVHPEGTGSRVRVSSTWLQRAKGFPAFFERTFAPRSLSRLHGETLRRLAEGG